ncbi:peptidase inhibitor family I36 protein [Streptomyces sp. NBC_00572]|uniref:peptidase inhibitor family I36 protein n=1 Tax=Streptomyces sp. NBC_00572 TaxID=2903664 RepID=UPI002252E142|nr:peptidase inhibitor family I36 protein [Streptomyces sp. NBC_00572]MCX4983085.1 peptidase inhibitor family I36 protein [Streptomyces sp. NBC_00572]
MKKMRAISAIAAIAFTAITGFAGSATAGSYNGVCESSNGGEVCLYDTNNYTGAVYDTLYSKPQYTGTYYGTNTPIDDTVTSTWNRDPDTRVWFFADPNYTGTDGGQEPGYKLNWEGGWSNKWSSHCFASNPSCPW